MNIQFNKRRHKSLVTGLEYDSIGLEGKNVCHNYFTAYSDIPGTDKLIINVMEDTSVKGALASYPEFNKECCLYLVDSDCREEFIDNIHMFYSAPACPNGFIYYTNGQAAYRFDPVSHRKTKIGENPHGVNFLSIPSVTCDGSRMALYWPDSESRKKNMGVLDTESGCLDIFLTPQFLNATLKGEDGCVCHPLMNPTDPEICFFCRDGRAELVGSRMWTFNLRTREFLNIYGQKKTIDDSNAEGVGHECWSADGEELFFVKYPHPVSAAGVTGVASVSKDGSKSMIINSDYPYLHVAPSPDGRYLVADTFRRTGNGAEGDLVLVDRNKGSSRLLTAVDQWFKHPGHIHPCFSQDGSRILFTFADKDKYLRVGIIYTKDILNY